MGLIYLDKGALAWFITVSRYNILFECINGVLLNVAVPDFWRNFLFSKEKSKVNLPFSILFVSKVTKKKKVKQRIIFFSLGKKKKENDFTLNDDLLPHDLFPVIFFSNVLNVAVPDFWRNFLFSKEKSKVNLPFSILFVSKVTKKKKVKQRIIFFSLGKKKKENDFTLNDDLLPHDLFPVIFFSNVLNVAVPDFWRNFLFSKEKSKVNFPFSILFVSKVTKKKKWSNESSFSFSERRRKKAISL